MPNIREYTSPIDKLNPDEKGYQAWEMAGRRIGPLFSQQASEIKEMGRINAQLITEAGKGQAELGKQAEQLNMDALDYLGALKQQRASGGGGGGGGRGGGGSKSPGPQRAGHAPTDQYAEAASNLASAANKVVGNKGGMAIDAGGQSSGSYDAAATDTAAYNQQNLGGISDTPSGSQINAWLKQGDAMAAAAGIPASTYTGWTPPASNPVMDPNTGQIVQDANASQPQSQSWMSSAYDTVANAAASAYNWAIGDSASQSPDAASTVTPDAMTPGYGF